MLTVNNLHFRYSRNGNSVLNGASLELKQGEIGILLGKNGSGKTTLFKNILGIERPDCSSMQFGGENLLKMNRRERARRIAYVPQHIHFGDLTVFNSVLMPEPISATFAPRLKYFSPRQLSKKCL